MTPAIICCAGRAKRFQRKLVPKQMLPINGVPLLDDTLGKLRSRGIVPHVAINRPRDFPDLDCAFLPHRDRWLAETIYSSRDLWDDKTIILLGDVYYTDNAMDKIAKSGGITFFHDTQDRFALVFQGIDNNIVFDALTRIINICEQGVCHGQLADLMRRLPHDEVLIDDETSDFDTEMDYNLFIAGRPKNKLWREKHESRLS